MNDLKEHSINDGNPIENSLIIIDDFANDLKDNNLIIMLNKMVIKARHLSCCFLFTLQSYYLLDLRIRKQLTNASIFKPKNKKEWESIAGELLNIEKDNMLKFYNYIYEKPYDHLDIDLTVNKFYKNFNELTVIEK